MVTDSVPPIWAQDGFTHKTAPWAVPWALGTPGDAVAMLFARQLVAGGSPRIDGTNNKVHWTVKDKTVGVVVEGRPYGKAEPVIGLKGGPAVEDVPPPGCWTFRVLWGAHSEHSSTINLEVLPAGTLPAK